MDSEIAQDGPAERSPDGAVATVPAPPVIPPGQLSRAPHQITYGARHGLGWQQPKKEGPCYVLLRTNALDMVKVLERYPLTEDGLARAWAALVGLDRPAAEATRNTLEARAASAAADAAERERQIQVYEAFVRAGSSHSVFRAFGVQVLADAGEVYTIGFHDPTAKTNNSLLLGPLAGAEAMVTDGSQAWSPGRAMFLPIGLAGLATKAKAHAAIVFSDGAVRTAELDGNSAVRDAQLQAVKFNALAGTSAPRTSESPSDPAGRLRQLKELLEEGLLSQEEYDAKRSEVINSI